MFVPRKVLPLLFAVLCFPSYAQDLIELQIRNTGDPRDDYLTWAPAPAQIRVISIDQSDVSVVLTNDDGSNGGGDLVFDQSVTPGNTAVQETLSLTLPGNGDWVPFVVAGKFGSPSIRDRDAVIEVHRDTADGELLRSHALMVRVRKNALSLTDYERDELLEALAELHFTFNQYIYFVMVHNTAGYGKFGDPGWDYPDQAHGAPAFLPWHRIFLLEFERKLQERFPHVTLPYWVQDQASNVFEENFFGANATTGGTGFPTLAASNPIFGWEMPPTAWWNPPQFDTTAPGTEAILRSNVDRQSASYLFQFTPEADLVRDADYETFAANLERNPHNNGHNSTGPWMQDCRISPRDPIFWVFHSQQDHLWARWQWQYGRFGTDGSDPNDYTPTGTYQGASPPPRGHFLLDTVWPWNGEEGGPTDDREARQPPIRLENFPTSTIPGLWPDAPAVPHPADTIDYMGLAADRLDMGFAYDNVPYGSQSVALSRSERVAGRRDAAMAEDSRKTFLNPQKSTGARMAAAPDVRLTKKSEPDQFLTVIRDESQPDEVRAAALRLLAKVGHDSFIPAALDLVRDESPNDEALDAEAARMLAVENMFFTLDKDTRASIHQALRDQLEDPRHKVRQVAMANLAPMRDEVAVKILREDLGRAKPLFARKDAIAWLASAGAVDHVDLLRPFLEDDDPEVRITAIRALGFDQASHNKILALIGDENQPESVRSAAITALMNHGDKDLAETLFTLLSTEGVSPRLQGEAVAALGIWARTRVPSMSDSQKLEVLRRLLDVPESVLKTHSAVVMRTLKRIHELSK